MSLINDALKKAQKQRTGEAPPLGSLPSVGGESASQISRRAKPAGFDTLFLRGGIGAGVLLVLVVGGYFAFRTKPEARGQKPETSKSMPGQTAPAEAPAVQTPAAVVQVSAPAVSPAASFTLQVAPKPEPAAPKPESPKPVVQQASPMVKAPVSQPAVISPQPVAVAAPQKLEPRAMTFIDNIKVAGIRASATDSKVLMNDRVYRVGDIVEHEMALKLTGITSNSLTFEDERGGRYTRTF